MFHSYTKTLASRLVFTVFAVEAIAFPAESSVAKPLAVVGGTIFTAPRDAPIEKGVVVLDDGKIVSVGLLDTVDVPSDAKTAASKNVTQLNATLRKLYMIAS